MILSQPMYGFFFFFSQIVSYSPQVFKCVFLNNLFSALPAEIRSLKRCKYQFTNLTEPSRFLSPYFLAYPVVMLLFLRK